MQTTTFLPRSARVRRVTDRFALATLAIGCTVALLELSRQSNFNPLPALAIPVTGGLVALIAWVLHRDVSRIEIDLENRLYRVVDRSTSHPWHPLDELGPIEVELRRSTVKTKQGRRTIVEYAVVARGRADLDLYLEKSARVARARMESIAKAWHLPARSLGGDLRQPGDLDRPLHERMANDARSRAAKALAPGWNVAITTEGETTRVESRHRDLSRALGTPILGVAPAVAVIAMIAFGGMRQLAGDASTSNWDLAFMAALAAALLAFAIYAGVAVRDAFFPGAVTITPDEIRYRRVRVPLDEVEEVLSHSGIEIVGDRTSIRLPAFWCAEAAVATVAHEIRRAIVERAATRMTRPSQAGPQLSGSV